MRVTPYAEDDIPRIVDQLGNADSLVLGSDFPHAEGVANPAEFQKLCDPLPADVQRAILRDNAAQLFAAA